MQKNEWKPTANFKNLQLRAKILAKIRRFFEEREVLEVETPALSAATVTDPYTQSVSLECISSSQLRTMYLQTSPEYAMKRLLAAGSGSIYQICKSFRNEESGRYHNLEFTMLEWYRIGFNHHDLMNEMDELLQTVIETKPAERFSYQQIFLQYLNIDPHTATVKELSECAKNAGIHISDSFDQDDRDNWLFLLITHCIEPHLGQQQPTFIYDFPETQATLARIRIGNPSVAERFEVYIKGIELANGFHELANAEEQRRRFNRDLEKRRNLNCPQVPIDENFLAALAQGLPDCSGVALGIDRLVMLAAKARHIEEVIPFPIQRA